MITYGHALFFLFVLICSGEVLPRSHNTKHAKLSRVNQIESSATPAQLAAAVSSQILAANNTKYFLVWDYGGAIITEALWDFASLFGLQNITKQLDDLLDHFISDSSQNGYKLLHGIQIPWGGAVGDTVGLYPIGYLGRVNYYKTHTNPNYNNSTDLKICNLVASDYLYKWPLTLPDGTFTRTNGWPGQPAGNEFLWADDQFMGMTLLSRMAAINHDIEFANRVGKMQLTYAQRELDTTDDVYWHGFNAANNQHSCCKWGRANGWILMSHVEVLLALKEFPAHPNFTAVLSLFQRHANGLAKFQDTDGRWHQVIDAQGTFLETSCTSMFIWSIITGIQEGWLSRTQYTPIIQNAWAGLSKVIQADGIVNGICEGTGIGVNLDFYEKRSTAYTASSPGLGSVLRAIAAYERFTNGK